MKVKVTLSREQADTIREAACIMAAWDGLSNRHNMTNTTRVKYERRAIELAQLFWNVSDSIQAQVIKQ